MWLWPSFLLATAFASVSASSTQRPAIRSVRVLEDVSFYSRDRTLRYDSRLEIAFTTARGPVQLELAPNLDLLHHGQPSVLQLDGTAYNVYKGSAMTDTGFDTRRVGSARIVVHSTRPLTFEGSFTVDGEMYNVQLARSYNSMKAQGDAEPLSSDDHSMVLWSDADLGLRKAKRTADTKRYEADAETSCQIDRLYPDPLQILPHMHRRQLSGDTGASFVTQAQLTSTIGQTAGCPLQREVAVLGAAADCNFVQAFNSTASARASIIAAFNSASLVYEDSFNISLGLGQIVISAESCPTTAASASLWNTACSDSITIGDRLSDFSLWRGSQSDTFAAWSLMTTCATGSEIGVAWLGTLCNANTTNQTTSTVSGTNVVAATTSGGSYWKTLAHELGHNFGASHDCTSSTCGSSTTCCPLSAQTCSAGGTYLMNPSSSSGATAFSPCTIGQVCSNMLNKRITTSCLSTNQNVKLAEGASSCGNGIVEDGEDCDCGGMAGCGSNSCCNPTTCKFNAGAVCDSQLSSCCTDKCLFSPANTTCRASTGSCDPAETCTGTSGSCPADVFATNGQSCGTNLQCASGQCTSRLLQCQQQMNGSRAPCDDLQCDLTCYVGNQCYIANSYFITGTPCGQGGFCQAGICDQGSLGHQIESWMDQNKKWLIPVVAVVGGVIVIVVIWSLISACVGRRNATKSVPQSVYSSQTYTSNRFEQPPSSWQQQPMAQSYAVPDYPSRTYQGYH